MAIVRMLIVLSAQLPVVNHLEHVCSFFCAVRQADACQLLRNLNPQQHFYQQQLQLQQQQQAGNIKRSAAAARNRNSNNRIIECDLIPSKKSKRKAAKKEAGGSENLEAVEPIVREQIRVSCGITYIMI